MKSTGPHNPWFVSVFDNNPFLSREMCQPQLINSAQAEKLYLNVFSKFHAKFDPYTWVTHSSTIIGVSLS
jgi:hypothetical protein